MKKTLLIYGLFLGVLGFLLRITEYWFWVKLNAFDIYIVLVSIVFLSVGLWLGRNLQQKNKEKTTYQPVNIDDSSRDNRERVLSINENALAHSGISKREHEVLVLIAKGMSNQEIADTLFVSQSTIKTHTSRLFEKLDVKNRTHAIVKAKELGIIATWPPQYFFYFCQLLYDFLHFNTNSYQSMTLIQRKGCYFDHIS